MIDKYEEKFKKMYAKIREEKSPLEAVSEHLPEFEKEGVSRIGILHYLAKFIRETNPAKEMRLKP